MAVAQGNATQTVLRATQYYYANEGGEKSERKTALQNQRFKNDHNKILLC